MRKKYQNWIHLDFKGMMPSKSRLLTWLEWLAARGVSGVVLEYEDRFPWETFSNTWRPGYNAKDWRDVHQHCADLGLEVIPFIQTFGHLEWLLKHEQWAHLRCANHINLLCPGHPDVRRLLESWINEVASMHPHGRFIHIGMDEVYHLGGCPACRAKAKKSKHGHAKLFLEHASNVCTLALAANRQPILWGDMILQYKGIDAEKFLPKEAIICHRKYTGAIGNFIESSALQGTRPMFGASAIRCAFPTHSHLVGELFSRLDNIRQWHAFAAESQHIQSLVHTVWGRSKGLAPLYGPWEGWLPAFELAANFEKKPSRPMELGLKILHEGINSGVHEVIERCAFELSQVHSEDCFEQAALKWWEFSLRYYAEVHVFLYAFLGGWALQITAGFQGCDLNLEAISKEVESLLKKKLTALKRDIRKFLSKYEWSDIDEYLEGRIGSLEECNWRAAARA